MKHNKIAKGVAIALILAATGVSLQAFALGSMTVCLF